MVGNSASTSQNPAPNLFAAGGDTQDYTAGTTAVAFLANHLKAKDIALLGYNIAASSDACKADAKGLQQAGFNVAYQDLSIPYGASLTPDVQRMTQDYVDFIISCMDAAAGGINLTRDMQQYGLKAKQLWSTAMTRRCSSSTRSC